MQRLLCKKYKIGNYNNYYNYYKDVQKKDI
jgi:hypothetical protein